MSTTFLDTWMTERRAELMLQRADLLAAVSRIDEMLAAMGEGNVPPAPARAATSNDRPVRKRRPMSEKARRAASKRMKAYWAARHAGK